MEENKRFMISENVINELAGIGFRVDGYDNVKTLLESMNRDRIPKVGGVYAIIIPNKETPKFKVWEFGASYTKKDRKTKAEKVHPLMYDTVELAQSWVKDSNIIYIGKADDLHKRLTDYIRYYLRLKECQVFKSKYNQVAHRGGRSIWQVEGAEDFMVVWMKTDSNENPKDVESALIINFKNAHGNCRPFANKRD